MSTPTRQLLVNGDVDVVATANDQTQIWPVNYVETMGAEWVEFVFYLKQINGAPTAAKLQAKFQKGASHTTGDEFSAPAWQDFSDFDVANRCLGGLAWGHQDMAGGGNTYARSATSALGTLHDSAVSGSQTLGYFVAARVIAPPDLLRVQLLPTFTGGASPSYRVSGYWVVKY